MTALQIVGAVVILAGVVWIFIHPTAKGESEASYAGITVKSVTQGGAILLVGLVLVYLGRAPGDDDLTLSEWSAAANKVCDEGYEKIHELQVETNSASQFQTLPQMTQIVAEINQEIQAIGRPSGSEANVDRLLAMASQANVEMRRAYSYWTAGDTQAAQTALSQAQALGSQVQQLDGELGAGVCALGA